MKNNYLVQAWLVLALAVCFGAALAGMQVKLQPLIEENKRNETYDQIPQLVPGADKGATEEYVSVDGKIAYKASAGGKHVGWVIKAAGQGFADKIELLIGLDPTAEKILGMYVLAQKETPALGNNIVKLDWRSQFSGLKGIDQVKVVKVAPGRIPPEKQKALHAANEVGAITGATISSQSVADIINKAVAEFAGKMGTLTKQVQKQEKGTSKDG